MTEFRKDPSAVLDYAWDWTGWLAASETITTAVITTEIGLTKDSQSIAAGVVTAWLSGGTAGENYDVACLITTNQGRVDERTLRIRVTQR